MLRQFIPLTLAAVLLAPLAASAQAPAPTTPPAPAAPATPNPNRMNGKITSVDAAAKTITVTVRKMPTVLSVPDGTKIFKVGDGPQDPDRHLRRPDGGRPHHGPHQRRRRQAGRHRDPPPRREGCRRARRPGDSCTRDARPGDAARRPVVETNPPCDWSRGGFTPASPAPVFPPAWPSPPPASAPPPRPPRSPVSPPLRASPPPPGPASAS